MKLPYWLLCFLPAVGFCGVLPCVAQADIVPGGSVLYGESAQESAVTESEFKEVIARLLDLYKPEVAALGGNLVINGEWVYPEFGASAQRLGNDWLITVYGGVARYRTMTLDALAFVVCHEIGHHLGGAPKKSQVLWKDWASNEGQADYFAASKCFPRYLRTLHEGPVNEGSAVEGTVSAKMREQCLQASQRQSAGALKLESCTRTAEAAFFTFESVRLLMREAKSVSFDAKDPNVVSTLFEDHPKAQCRLDTAVAGMLCPKPVSENFDNENPSRGACNQDFFPEFGRPACWFPAALSTPKKNF